MRYKEFLKDHKSKLADNNPQETFQPLGTSSGIMARDHLDVCRADLIVFNFLYADGEKSLGTAMEIAWAYEKRVKGCVTIFIGAEDEVNIRHPMVKAVVDYRVNTIDEALELIPQVLLP